MQTDIFDHCTDRLKYAIIDAKSLAQRRGDHSVWPEHLFLSIAHNGCASAVFDELGLSLAGLQEEFAAELRSGGSETVEPELDEKSLAVLERAQEFAQSLRHSFLGDEHLIWGLVEVPSHISLFLRSRGLTSAAIREKVLHLLGPGIN